MSGSGRAHARENRSGREVAPDTPSPVPEQTFTVLIAVVGISLISIVGALLLVMKRDKIQRWLPFMVAVAAGALLGDTFLHLIPHAVAQAGGFTNEIAWWILGGVIGFFVIESLIHWHHHGEDVHEHGPDGVHSLGWMNLLGDFVHNFIDGLIIAGAFLLSPEAGWATTIAVLLHEIPQEFGDFGVLLHAGFKPRTALLLNLGSGLSAVLGALIVLAIGHSVDVESTLGPLAAGGFIYIACADLVPELRTRAKGVQVLTTMLALAIGLGAIVLVHELPGFGCGPGHGHGHSHSHSHSASPGAGSDHGHDHSHGTDGERTPGK